MTAGTSTRGPGRGPALGAAGPAFLVAVGYVDPGNWGTDLAAGSRYGYRLLWVLVVASALALLLQHLSARLGMVTGADLAEHVRRRVPGWALWPAWLLLESGMLLTELAELLGVVVALRLLLHLPLLGAVALAAALVTGLLLAAGRSRRRAELIVLGLLGVVAVAYAVQVALAAPGPAVAGGLVPGGLSGDALLVAVGIIGATAMPHNLILHSRAAIGAGPGTLRHATVVTAGALNLALLLNAAILVVAASAFHPGGQAVETLAEAHAALGPMLGQVAAGLFAWSLLAAGLASSLTGSLAGQYVTEAFLGRRPPLLVRRLVTLVPAAGILAAGVPEVLALVWSQAALCLLLPALAWPLAVWTASRAVMGDHLTGRTLRAAAVGVATLLTVLDGWLLVGS